ncbi:MAG: phosphatase PAP2 family protein, partial [Candidatus Heimdallarchaeota archaeon]
LLGTSLFGSFYGRFNANPYAAVPSLHAAYSFISAYYAIKKYGWNRTWWMIFYPLGVWTAAVYLNHHFIVDLAAGVLYVFIGVRISRLIRKSMANRRKKKQEEVMLEDPESDNGPVAEQLDIETEDAKIEKDLEIKP